MNFSLSRPARCRCLLLLAALLAFTVSRASAQTASQLYTEGVRTYEAGNVDEAKRNLRLALEVDRNFRPAAALLAKIAADERQAGAPPAGASVQALERVMLSVEFKDTSLQTAVEFLRQRIAEQSGGKVDANFVLKLPADLANKKITLRLDHVPATEVMRYLGNVAGVDFKVEPYAVLVVPTGMVPAR